METFLVNSACRKHENIDFYQFWTSDLGNTKLFKREYKEIILKRDIGYLGGVYASVI